MEGLTSMHIHRFESEVTQGFHTFAPFVPRLLLSAGDREIWQAEGTFLFADISGFTRLSEQLAELGKAGAEELTDILNATFEALLGVARDEGGDLVKFGGDALFVFFEGEHHGERACRAAFGMRAALKARGAVVTARRRVLLRISMGLHSGPFLFILAGTEQRELFVAGEHATTVTAMETAADAGEILMSASTAALLPTNWLGGVKEGGVLLRRVTGEPSAPVETNVVDERDDALALFVPRSVQRRLLGRDHGAEHRHVTVGFVHVGGVDALLRTEGPRAVAERLNQLVNVAHEIAERHAVCLIASDVAGGGVKMILTAGVPDAVEDGEGRMLAVGRALLDADVGLPIRVGLNTGHVFAGEVGAPWRRVYTVMGDAVNLAARFMAKAAPGEMVASQTTIERSSTPFETTALEPFFVKGKRHPQHAVSVGRRAEGRGRVTSANVALVGRHEELAVLTDALSSAAAGRGSCIELVGEPGIGKSRLAHEVANAAEASRVVRLTCEPFAADQPYFAARLVLRTAIGVPLNAEPAIAGAQLTRWLVEHAPEWAQFAPLLAAAIDAEVPSSPVVDDLSAEYRASVLREAAAVVMHAAFVDPLLLVIEDVMWMDEASALLLARSMKGIEHRPWLTCLTTRDPSQGLGARLGFDSQVITLAPLDDTFAEHLASELTDDGDIGLSELRELCARAQGNPLFLLELARARREFGSLDAIPEALEDLVAARIDHLAPLDRTLLRHAAVLGDRFSPDLFRRTLGDVIAAPALWHRLADFLVVDQGDLRFTHDLVRRVAYEGLPFARRRELHSRIGHALVPPGQPDDTQLGLLALHFDRSGEHSLAWRYNRDAAQRAWDKYATVEATAFFDRAIANARSSAAEVSLPELAKVYEALADVALLAGRYDLARTGLAGARKASADDVIVRARLCRKEGTLRERLGRHDPAITWYRRGLSGLGVRVDHDVFDADAAAERARLQMACASTLIWQQRYRQCAQRCRRALPDAIAAGDRATEAHAYYLLDWALSELGDDASLDYRELAQPIYEELGDFAGLAAVLQNRGVDALTAGKWDESCAYFEDGVVASRRSGDLMRMAQCWQNLAEVRVEQGRYAEAEAFLRDARRSCRASGHAMGFAAATNTLGRTLARAGRAEDGVALLLEAQQRFVALGHGPFLAETEARLAEALVFAGRNAQALDVLDDLGGRADDGGAPVAALAERMRGTVAAGLGDTRGARASLLEARRIADKGGAEWESALAALEIARLADTPRDEHDLLQHEADAVLSRMGIDASRVMPPAPLAKTVAGGASPSDARY